MSVLKVGVGLFVGALSLVGLVGVAKAAGLIPTNKFTIGQHVVYVPFAGASAMATVVSVTPAAVKGASPTYGIKLDAIVLGTIGAIGATITGIPENLLAPSVPLKV